MTTTTRRAMQQFLATMLLGAILSAGIWILAEPESAWIGFAIAAIQRARPGGRCVQPGVPSR